MPLPAADEGIAGNLQRSENRRNSVSQNDCPGTVVKARIEAHMKKKMMESLKGLVSKVVGVVCLCFVVSMIWKHKKSILGAILGL